jgi:hypothetical protein
MFNPGSLVRCKFLSAIYTPLGLIIRKVNIAEYEVLVMHGRDPKRQYVETKNIEVINENR